MCRSALTAGISERALHDTSPLKPSLLQTKRKFKKSKKSDMAL